MELNDNNEQAPHLLKVPEAAAMLGVSSRTIWRMIADGELTARRFRRCTRLMLSQVSSYVKVEGKVGGV